MVTTERAIPPLTADERTTLESWLDFQRATLARKVAGLTDEQAREPAAPPSALSLLGLVQHMGEVERQWFRRVLQREAVPWLYGPGAGGEARTAELLDEAHGGFAVAPDASLARAVAVWQEQIARSRSACAPLSLDAVGTVRGQEVSLRWIYLHMIEEYARHNGHADLLRERTDGETGH
ncbi:DinB family protein [Streptomyces rectiverticillatus]|uniref:DinB family protein n=1 Tax=Streptomyces rectiverticillatus TaxID=173860 RepID=UPI0015C2E775|nr:DinB family protein [Streptomyces rectiverticillatus]QLE72878.1 DinB family protein [Streptomyces rectiverticillatus]